MRTYALADEKYNLPLEVLYLHVIALRYMIMGGFVSFKSLSRARLYPGGNRGLL